MRNSSTKNPRDSGVFSRTRIATAADRAALLGVHEAAFGQQGPEIVELVTGLLSDQTATPLLSLVAEVDQNLVGHVLFTAVQLQSDQQDISAQIMAPLAVTPACQGNGIGRSLVTEGLKQLAASGIDLVFVLGHPAYYPRFGFRPAGVLGYTAPYPIPTEHADAWMVRELTAGVIGRMQGTVQCAETLNQARYW